MTNKVNFAVSLYFAYQVTKIMLYYTLHISFFSYSTSKYLIADHKIFSFFFSLAYWTILIVLFTCWAYYANTWKLTKTAMNLNHTSYRSRLLHTNYMSRLLHIHYKRRLLHTNYKRRLLHTNYMSRLLHIHYKRRLLPDSYKSR